VARRTGFSKSARRGRSTQKSKSSSWVLVLIGSFKLLKALLLIAVGIGAIKFLHKDIVTTVTHWTEVLRVDPENQLVHGVLVRILRVTPKQLKELSVGTFLCGPICNRGLGAIAAQTMGGVPHDRYNGRAYPTRDFRTESSFHIDEASGCAPQRANFLVLDRASPVAFSCCWARRYALISLASLRLCTAPGKPASLDDVGGTDSGHIPVSSFQGAETARSGRTLRSC
jgi:hypothetical protein